MLLALVLLLLVLTAVLAAIVALALNVRLTWRRLLVRRRVIVNLKGGTALSGVLFTQRGPLLVLRNATLHESGQRIPVDGEAVVEREQVDWIQSLAAKES